MRRAVLLIISLLLFAFLNELFINTSSQSISFADKDNRENITTTRFSDVHSAEATLSQPERRSATFSYLTKTVAEYSTIETSPQKSSPANSSLLREEIGLTLDQGEAWRTFSLPSTDVFLAVDGASQSDAIAVRIELFSPVGSLVAAGDTTAAQPLHYVSGTPAAGEWTIHVLRIVAGNTTVWIQALTFTNGSRLVLDYHKELLFMHAGEAVYYRIPITTDEWFNIYSERISGASTYYELFAPSDYSSPWKPPLWDVFDSFFAFLELPSTGTYLLVVRNIGGKTDVITQITKPQGVTKTLPVNTALTVRFKMANENEHFFVDVSQSYLWLALDGAVTSSGWAKYTLRPPDASPRPDQYSWGDQYFCCDMVPSPDSGKWILIVRGSGADVLATVRITVSGGEDGQISSMTDILITFDQSGQTQYYSIDTTNRGYFIYSGSSIGYGRSTHTLFTYRYEQTWFGDCWDSYPQATLIVPVGNTYLLRVQGASNSDVMIHVRFPTDADYSLSTPDYSDFELRFAGDFIMYRMIIPSFRYFIQYWHNLASMYGGVWIYDGSFSQMKRVDLWSQESEERLIWREDHETFSPGDWVIFLTSNGNGSIRVSQLKTGDEERNIDTPFQMFETFDFDYQAKLFTVNIEECEWFSLVSQGQNDARFCGQTLGPDLSRLWEDIYLYYREQMSHKFLKDPPTGACLLVVDGLSNTNASLTFYTSSDPMQTITIGQPRTENFTYYGESHYSKAIIENASFIALDAMWLTQKTQYIDLVSPTSEQYPTQSTERFSVAHIFQVSPLNGTWYLILIGQPDSSLTFQVTNQPDLSFEVPFVHTFNSNYDGKAVYGYFDVQTNVVPLQINITNNLDASSWFFLHEPDGGPFWYWYGGGYVYHLTQRGQFESLTITLPKVGLWFLGVVQENYANVTISVALTEHPRPPGVFVRFVQPADAQLFMIDDKLYVVPKISGTVRIVVNITDHFHAIVDAILYYNGGMSRTDLVFNITTNYYETFLDTRDFEDGLHELVAYGGCNEGEIGISSIALVVDNSNRFPVLPSDLGCLHVYVTNTGGDPILGVTLISITQPQQQTSLTGTTDLDGYKAFDGVKVGIYTIQASKTGCLTAMQTASILSNQITTISITLTSSGPEDTMPPAVSVLISPSNPYITQNVTFLVTATDDVGGSGIASISLYIDGFLVKTWIAEGTHSYTPTELSDGAHTYYAVATDNYGNVAGDPIQGSKSFQFASLPQVVPTELLIVLIALVAILGVSVVILRVRKQKKTR